MRSPERSSNASAMLTPGRNWTKWCGSALKHIRWWGPGNENPKLQIPNSKQIPNPKPQSRIIRAWRGFGAGASSRHRYPERMEITQPRAARKELPWGGHRAPATLKGLHQPSMAAVSERTRWGFELPDFLRAADFGFQT